MSAPKQNTSNDPPVNTNNEGRDTVTEEDQPRQSTSSQIGNAPRSRHRSSSFNIDPDISIVLTKCGSLSYQVYPGTERENYDFTAERVSLYSNNLIESTAHLIKSCVGAGILSIHVGFMYAGLWTALIASVVLGLLVWHCMTMLIRSAHKMYVRLRIPKLSYPDLAEVAVATGPWRCTRKYSRIVRYVVDICIFVEMCGTCCIYEIMIASSFKETLSSISPKIQEFNMDLRFYILIVSVPLLWLCMIRSLKLLAPVSLVADVFVLICVLTAMYYSFSKVTSITDRPFWKSFEGLMKFCGVFLYCINGVPLMMPIENNMRKPKYYYIVLQYGMFTIVLLSAGTGFFGYWGWGETCRSPITTHLPNNVIGVIIQILLILMLSATFAVHFWVPFRIVWHYFERRYQSKRDFMERLYRVIQLFVITGISVAFPNLVRLMIFVGNFFLSIIAFIFPAIIESLVTWPEPRRGYLRWILIKNTILIMIGIAFCVSAFYYSFVI